MPETAVLPLELAPGKSTDVKRPSISTNPCCAKLLSVQEPARCPRLFTPVSDVNITFVPGMTTCVYSPSLYMNPDSQPPPSQSIVPTIVPTIVPKLLIAQGAVLTKKLPGKLMWLNPLWA